MEPASPVFRELEITVTLLRWAGSVTPRHDFINTIDLVTGSKEEDIDDRCRYPRKIENSVVQDNALIGILMVRSLVIWGGGMLASVVIGGLVGAAFVNGNDGRLYGMLAGGLAFACARLWATSTR